MESECRVSGFSNWRRSDPVRRRDYTHGDLNHPGGCVGYRIEWAGKSVALIYDTEHVGDRLDPNVLALIGNVDLMVYDCTYTDDEMKRCFGYGHSTLASRRSAGKGCSCEKLRAVSSCPEPYRSSAGRMRAGNARTVSHGFCGPRPSSRNDLNVSKGEGSSVEEIG